VTAVQPELFGTDPPPASHVVPGHVNGALVDLDASPANPAPPGEVALFRLDGRTFTIPARSRVNVGLKYLWIAKTSGEGAADQWLLEQLVGTEGYQALMNHDGLEADQLTRIMQAAQRTVLGGMEPGKA